MNRHLILWPALVLVAITFAVWLRMLMTRVGGMKERKIHPQAVASRAQLGEVMGDLSAPADNFLNLFELPVLFYFLVALLHQQVLVPGYFVAGAWLYAALRGAHSWIHCTYNKVMHRFTIYLASCAVLWLLWAAYAVQVARTRF